jgi:AcrR family transcriptional regulator
MTNDEQHFHKKPAQARGEQAIQNIFEAARSIVQSNESDQMSARSLSVKSGYSIGAIYRYFEKIDDVFTFVFISRRKSVCQQLINKIEAHPYDASGQELFEFIVDHTFQAWAAHRYNVIRLLYRQFFKRSKEPEKFNTLIDMLIPSLLELAKRNRTGSIKQLSETEIRICLRAFQGALNSPFI